MCDDAVSPEITASLLVPCSSLAILSASSISIIPKPCKMTGIAQVFNTFCCFSGISASLRKELTSFFFFRVKIYLVLELAGVSAADGNYAPVHVELSDDWRTTFELWAEGLSRAATQAQQANQDVLLGVLVGEKGLPAAVSHIVPPYQLHLKRRTRVTALGGCRSPPQTQRSRQRCPYLVWSDLVVDFLNADFSGPDVATLRIFGITLTGQRVQTKSISVIGGIFIKRQTSVAQTRLNKTKLGCKSDALWKKESGRRDGQSKKSRAQHKWSEGVLPHRSFLINTWEKLLNPTACFFFPLWCRGDGSKTFFTYLGTHVFHSRQG